MSQHDTRSATRLEPDQVMVDIADYVVDYKIQSPEAFATARYMLLDSLGCESCALEADAGTISTSTMTEPLWPTLPGPGKVTSIGRIAATQSPCTAPAPSRQSGKVMARRSVKASS